MSTEENLRELARLVNEDMDAASQECRRHPDVLTEELVDVDRRLEGLKELAKISSPVLPMWSASTNNCQTVWELIY